MADGGVFGSVLLVRQRPAIFSSRVQFSWCWSFVHRAAPLCLSSRPTAHRRRRHLRLWCCPSPGPVHLHAQSVLSTPSWSTAHISAPWLFHLTTDRLPSPPSSLVLPSNSAKSNTSLYRSRPFQRSLPHRAHPFGQLGPTPSISRRSSTLQLAACSGSPPHTRRDTPPPSLTRPPPFRSSRCPLHPHPGLDLRSIRLGPCPLSAFGIAASPCCHFGPPSTAPRSLHRNRRQGPSPIHSVHVLHRCFHHSHRHSPSLSTIHSHHGSATLRLLTISQIPLTQMHHP